jgi:uncharacterized protein involved in outer membrane biogenesis
MKFLRKILFSIITLSLLASLTLWILTKSINPETIKQLINQQITLATHKESQINGAISWQLFPRPGLKFNQLLIGNVNSKDDYSLSIDKLLLNLKITPLLRGKFVFSEIHADGFKLEFNPENTPINESNAQQKTISPQDSKKNKQFAIQKLILSHGQLIINNKQGSAVVKNIQIGAEQINFKNNPFSVQIKGKLINIPTITNAKASLNFKGRLSFSPSILEDIKNGISQSSIEGQLFLSNITLNQFVISKVNATLKSHKGSLISNPFTLSLYKGESIGDIELNLISKELLINQTATNLDGKKFMTALLGNKSISGRLDYSIHAVIPLKDLNLEHIESKGTLTLKDGEVFNLNIEQLITTLKTKLNALASLAPSDPKKSIESLNWDQSKVPQGNTPFKLANFKYTLAHGIMESNSFLLQTDRLNVNGQGNLDLLKKTLNSKLKASFLDSYDDKTLQQFQKVLGGSFPITVTGSIEHPTVAPDFSLINPFLSALIIKNTITTPIKIIGEPLKELLN